MNLLQGGSGINDTQSESAQTAAPMANVEENSDAGYAAAAAPVAAKPSPTVIEEAAAEPEPAPPAPEPRPVTPDVQAMAASPKKSGGKVVAVLVMLLLAAGAGIGGWWFLTQRGGETASPAPVEVAVATPSGLIQKGADGKDIAAKGSTNQTSVKFNFTLATSANTGSVVPEVELRPVGTAFTGEPTITGQEVSADGNDLNFSVESDTLTQGNYHWQARVKKGEEASEWAIFGDDASTVAFSIDTAPPAQPTVSSIGGQPVANPTVVTSNTPAFSGKADAGSKITIAVGTESNITATTDSNGSWTATPTTQIANGQHDVTVISVDPAGNSSSQLKLALTVNPVTAADTAPKPSVSSGQTSTPPPATPAPDTTLAPTGDDTSLVSLISLCVLALSIVGFMVIRRRYAT